MQRYVLPGAAILVLWTVAAVLSPQRPAVAHCQVPCGIYDDPARIRQMLEDVTTIGKAVDQIRELSAKNDALSLNQAIRWINTKEQHASNIITTVAEYFLTQKVKEEAKEAPGYAAYLEQLATHHRVMRTAMKCKQTVDPAAVAELKGAVEALGKLYPAQ